MAKRSNLHHSQTLYDICWKPTKNGGMVRDRIFARSGDHILRPATIEDMTPNKRLYMIDPYDKTKFYETSFASQVEWNTVLELFNTKTYYVERSDVITNKKSPPSHDQGTGYDNGDNLQGGLFDS